MNERIPLYPHAVAYAKEHGELEAFRSSVAPRPESTPNRSREGER